MAPDRVRVLGVDLGDKRIGLAVSDPTGTVASPAGMLARQADHGADHDALAGKLEELGAEAVVVGLPRSLSGGIGPRARLVLEEVAELRNRLAVPVHTCDERFSSVVATRALRQSRGRPVGASRRRQGDVDAAAAAVFLQGWLESKRGPAPS